jgi:hypothetical protein
MSVEISHVIEIRQKGGKWKPLVWYSTMPCWYNERHDEPSRWKRTFDYIRSFPKWHKILKLTWKDLPGKIKEIWTEKNDDEVFPYDKPIRVRGQKIYPRYVIDENDITFRDVFMGYDGVLSQRGCPDDMDERLKIYVTGSRYHGSITHYTLAELDSLLETYNEKAYKKLEKFNTDKNLYAIGKKVGANVSKPYEYGSMADNSEVLGIDEVRSLHHLYYTFSAMVEQTYDIVSSNDVRITSWSH